MPSKRSGHRVQTGWLGGGARNSTIPVNLDLEKDEWKEFTKTYATKTIDAAPGHLQLTVC